MPGQPPLPGLRQGLAITVHEELARTKDVGYTTTLKLMQIMNEKGIVRRDDSMRTHVYQAAVNKEKTQKHFLFFYFVLFVCFVSSW